MEEKKILVVDDSKHRIDVYRSLAQQGSIVEAYTIYAFEPIPEYDLTSIKLRKKV